ncbi:MAG TPA: hypothetical protein PKG56_01905 [Chitinophagaceae bacterium]|nr:hypothetical protein [Chitinophagaceae bacterium]MCC6635216.1 hypothetical protein [Chitinophagaceae bacterium]HMZ46318.1 hypothetical protein [Chitinophagaceae bacterium]HNF29586.1 hypothetical protein [Chitinophagaceae bacterium]HNJ57750.1 hypothetical protein [Chitinophagaceae bacterium]
MRFIKLALISFLLLFIVVTAIGLLLPSTVIVSRAIDINAPKDSVYNKVKNIYGWREWIAGMDKPEVNITSPTEANLFGTKVNITNINDTVITSTWLGRKGSLQESVIRIIHYQNTPQIVVQWQFTESLKWYPWQRFGSMMNEAVTGKQLENNLAALKMLVEKK